VFILSIKNKRYKLNGIYLRKDKEVKKEVDYQGIRMHRDTKKCPPPHFLPHHPHQEVHEGRNSGRGK